MVLEAFFSNIVIVRLVLEAKSPRELAQRCHRQPKTVLEWLGFVARKQKLIQYNLCSEKMTKRNYFNTF